MARENTGTGEVSDETIFEYHQQEDLIWATYAGGSIRFGSLTGLMLSNGKDDTKLEFRYNHVNQDNQFMTGKCQTKIELLRDGRLRLNEQWQWTSGDCSSGTSIVDEVSPNS